MGELQINVHGLSLVERWLTMRDGALDGVYLQYEKSMLTLEGAESLRQLSQKFMIGVWTYSGIDPDDYDTFKSLVQNGHCTFVNTDLPQNFKNDILVKPTEYEQGSLLRLKDIISPYFIHLPMYFCLRLHSPSESRGETGKSIVKPYKT